MLVIDNAVEYLVTLPAQGRKHAILKRKGEAVDTAVNDAFQEMPAEDVVAVRNVLDDARAAVGETFLHTLPWWSFVTMKVVVGAACVVVLELSHFHAWPVVLVAIVVGLLVTKLVSVWCTECRS